MFEARGLMLLPIFAEEGSDLEGLCIMRRPDLLDVVAVDRVEVPFDRLDTLVSSQDVVLYNRQVTTDNLRRHEETRQQIPMVVGGQKMSPECRCAWPSLAVPIWHCVPELNNGEPLCGI